MPSTSPARPLMACLLVTAFIMSVACATEDKPVGEKIPVELASVDIVCPVGGEAPAVLNATEGQSDLDRAPRPIAITNPQYPADAFAKRIEGVVTVEVFINSKGRVVRARVLESVPGLDLVAAETTCGWVFEPGIKDGRPVATTANAPVRFAIY